MEYEVFQQYSINFVATRIGGHQTIAEFSGMGDSYIPLYLTSSCFYHTFNVWYEIQPDSEKMRLDKRIVLKFIHGNGSVYQLPSWILRPVTKLQLFRVCQEIKLAALWGIL